MGYLACRLRPPRKQSFAQRASGSEAGTELQGLRARSTPHIPLWTEMASSCIPVAAAGRMRTMYEVAVPATGATRTAEAGCRLRPVRERVASLDPRLARRREHRGDGLRRCGAGADNAEPRRGGERSGGDPQPRPVTEDELATVFGPHALATLAGSLPASHFGT